MEWKELEWKDIEIDDSLPPLLPPITNRPVDLTTTTDKRYAAPRQYIWVTTSGYVDESCPRPLQACEIGDTSLSHEYLLEHLKIYHIEKPGIPYLRWEFPPDVEALSRL